MQFDANAFLSEVAELLEEDPSFVQRDTNLLDLKNWDSMNVISFITLVDERFDLILAPDEIGSCETVGELLALIEQHEGCTT